MTCAFCSGGLVKFMDMGKVSLAGGFLKPEQFAAEKKYPLSLGFCPDCYAVQVMEPVKPAELFANYFYFSSATQTAREHFRRLAAEVSDLAGGRLVVEIGCNDGVLMGPLENLGVDVVGVDPSPTNHDPEVIHDYFCPMVAERIIRTKGKAKVVVACNVFAHVESPVEFTREVAYLLDHDGVFILEAHHLGSMVKGLQYDWIYHEHRYYYSILTLMRHFERQGLCLYDVKAVDTHGGSIRCYVDKGKRKTTERVRQLMEVEISEGLYRLETFQKFAERAESHRDELREACRGVRVAYGASGRANTIIQYAGLDLDYIVDDAPAKAGFYTPGSHIPIVGRDRLEQDRPEKVLCLAWPYYREISEKVRGQIVVPLPSVRTVQKGAWQHLEGVGEWRT